LLKLLRRLDGKGFGSLACIHLEGSARSVSPLKDFRVFSKRSRAFVTAEAFLCAAIACAGSFSCAAASVWRDTKGKLDKMMIATATRMAVFMRQVLQQFRRENLAAQCARRAARIPVCIYAV
jgi:hypothetical protein